MNHSLHNLLDTVRYDPHKDTLFLVGDILAKSTEAGSLAILDFFAQQKLACTKHRLDAAGRSTRHSSCKPVYAVRGNHDQMIVQWRAWRDWFEPLQLAPPSPSLFSRCFSAPSPSTASYDIGKPVGTGSEFLALIEDEWLQDRTTDPTGAGSDVEEWIEVARKRAHGTWRADWWKRIPRPGKGRTSKDWIMFGDHYWIARDMKADHAQFLFSLPLVIHVPSEHFFLVHAGLLPFDPRRPSTDKHQPLAHLPISGDDDEDYSDMPKEAYDYPLLDISSQRDPPPVRLDDETEELRVVQERSILHDVPQNRDPWTLLNLRGVRKNGKVTRESDQGTPWAKIWNTQMKRCGGFSNASGGADAGAALRRKGRSGDRDEWEEDAGAGHDPLPCYPSTAVYGHAASRDLDVRRWTVGLDTGCLYGRRLTALVLSREGDEARRPFSPFDDELYDDEGPDGDGDEDGADGDDEDDWNTEGPFGDVNARHARVGRGAVASGSRRPPTTWTRRIKFGDRDADIGAKLVSVKCPKVADLS
ncbi:uncharacterized protein BXZ73DRAFT_86878 [Epithele typhae]|uniref:uncharacterized protein n=1 Tax=Epithele typhae TaxID=378194 RepID=UPI0020085875|nr:uncharacterized protein BXZ73DRAFT_86878 [Epithele typhae]KAH9945386.1 hypothetical protein BXZ73DRAFT_86878 [Epithele typhae]